MADLADFETPAPEQTAIEEDPAAAFLKREQDELAGLEDDNFGGDTGTQGTEDYDPFGAGGAQTQQTDDFMGGSQATAEPTTNTEDEDFGGMTNNTEEAYGGLNDNLGLGLDAPAADTYGGLNDNLGLGLDAPATDTYGGLNDNLGLGLDAPAADTYGGYNDDFGLGLDAPAPEMQPTDSYSAISQVDKLQAEPEKIKLWREENARRIEKKDEEETKRVEEWKEIAKKELDDWYKHHDEQLTKTKENNRESEAAFVAERDQTQPGEEWEKICRLCEFNPKNSKNTKDISRMRSILLQLKQTPLVR